MLDTNVQEGGCFIRQIEGRRKKRERDEEDERRRREEGKMRKREKIDSGQVRPGQLR
jgi:hypothetical protein